MSNLSVIGLVSSFIGFTILWKQSPQIMMGAWTTDGGIDTTPPGKTRDCAKKKYKHEFDERYEEGHSNGGIVIAWPERHKFHYYRQPTRMMRDLAYFLVLVGVLCQAVDFIMKG